METIVIIGTLPTARTFARDVLKVDPKSFLWISPRDPFAMQRLRGRTEENLVVYRPFAETACADVEEWLRRAGAREVAT